MSGLIPQPFIDELLNQTDIVELIDSYVPLKKSGSGFVACCPFHNEKTPSFNVIAKKQFYYCFGCGASGNAISFAMNYFNQGFVEAIETLASRLGLSVPREGNTDKNQQSVSLYQLLEQVSQLYQRTLKSQGQAAINYLRQRGMSGEIAKRYQLGYAPAGWQNLEASFKRYKNELIATGMLIQKDGKTYDRYRHRIMFPIHDRHGRIIGFGGRAIDATQKPKYLNSPETVLFQKSRELYGLHQILQEHKSIHTILIVEGYMDVIALAQHGINNAVATLGTATSIYHIQLLGKYAKQLIFCFDGDTAGRQAAFRALEACLPQVNTGLDARFIFLPEAHDPDSLVREEGSVNFNERLQKATPLNQFLLDTLSKEIDLSTLSGKSQLVNAAKPYLFKMQEGSYTQLLLDELARLTHIESHRLRQLIHDKPSKKIQNVTKTIARSPIRLAIAILIQNPEIYAACKNQVNPDLLDGKGQEILQKLLHQLAQTQEANTATLIEKWRNTSLFVPLVKLAGWEHQVPEQALAKEFVDIILFLQKQNLENKINRYIAKSRNEGLTITEKLSLQEMLRQRHQIMDDKK
ncbi:MULTISPECIES: DNA primase [unclassified Legionella]|uniref:DNA primase n=1 Tax=unclassified Legionella TaxID=2622702 RepID=UPI001056A760|nr:MULTISPECIES: DNA primase [unclassified Legionella]MDI9819770.1 DNA primase [Legionella sp. PL877]